MKYSEYCKLQLKRMDEMTHYREMNQLDKVKEIEDNLARDMFVVTTIIEKVRMRCKMKQRFFEYFLIALFGAFVSTTEALNNFLFAWLLIFCWALAIYSILKQKEEFFIQRSIKKINFKLTE
ncbi:MAG: hypothetical protein RSC93_03270 [Erysipelotrichaceae bacterium]